MTWTLIPLPVIDTPAPEELAAGYVPSTELAPATVSKGAKTAMRALIALAALASLATGMGRAPSPAPASPAPSVERIAQCDDCIVPPSTQND